MTELTEPEEGFQSQLGERLPPTRIADLLKRETKAVRDLLAEGWSLLPPKAPGRFEASFHGRPGVFRYWDGQTWSLPSFSPDEAPPEGKIGPKIHNAMFWRHPT